MGMSHRTAPIEVRERFHVADDRRPRFLAEALSDPRVRECVVLSTCNRTELYLRSPEAGQAEAAATGALAGHAGMEPARVRSHLYARHGREAAAHLFRVTAGLDSMVVGEPQIQGQVSEAYGAARDAGADALGPVLHRLFQTALSAGGEVRARTAVSEGATSVPAAAVRLATKVFGSLEGRRAVVVGAGEMGVLTLSALLDRGVADAAVASRTAARAEAAADRTGARPVSYPEVWETLDRVDVLVTSTSAPEPVVTEEGMRERRGDARGPVVVIDIAVPRDVEAAVGELPDVFLYNVDDLQRVVESTRRDRRRERGSAEELLEESVQDFWSWYRAREAVPLIRGIRERAERIRDRELSEALGEIDGLTPEDRRRIHRASRLVLKKVLHGPTVGLRELARDDEAGDLLEVARRLFEAAEEGDGSGAAGEPADADGSETEDASIMDAGSGR